MRGADFRISGYSAVLVHLEFWQVVVDGFIFLTASDCFILLVHVVHAQIWNAQVNLQLQATAGVLVIIRIF